MSSTMREEQQSMNVRTATFDFMRAVGVNTIFGNPGSTELGMFYNFPNDFRYVLGLQEASVVGMADGYAQAVKNAAFVNLHSAAGVGNAMGNIFTAYKNKTPLVITAGQQARSLFPDDPYLYSANATELPRPYVKWAIEPARAEDVPRAIARAYYVAMLPPQGPVLVSIPSDDWDKTCNSVLPLDLSSPGGAEVASLKKLAAALANARHPALVVGAEVDRAGAWEEMVHLAERSAADVYVAPLASRRGFPERHPQFQGFLPGDGAKIRDLLGRHDVVAVIGAPAFTYHVESKCPAVRDETELYLLSEDSDVLARSPRGSAILGGIKQSLECLGECHFPHRSPASHALPPVPKPGVGSPLTVAHVLSALDELRADHDIIVEEAPTARVVMNDHLPILEPGTFYTMDSGGLGFGMPAAVGIALAKPERTVICVVGDGSAMYSIQSLWSAAQHRANVKFVVLNNRKYAAMKRFAGVFNFPKEMEVVGTDLPGLDFVALAGGHGVQASRVTDSSQVTSALAALLSCEGPALLEAVVL